MCAATTDAGVSCWFIVSSVLGSTPWAITTLPWGAAWATAGTTANSTASANSHGFFIRTSWVNWASIRLLRVLDGHVIALDGLVAPGLPHHALGGAVEVDLLIEGH